MALSHETGRWALSNNGISIITWLLPDKTRLGKKDLDHLCMFAQYMHIWNWYNIRLINLSIEKIVHIWTVENFFTALLLDFSQTTGWEIEVSDVNGFSTSRDMSMPNLSSATSRAKLMLLS